MSRLLREHDAGWVVPVGDPGALAAAFRQILAGGERVEARRAAGRELLRRFSWEAVLEPLVRFCARPEIDPTKEEFAFRPPTYAPPDRLSFRVRRWLGRRWHAVAAP